MPLELLFLAGLGLGALVIGGAALWLFERWQDRRKLSRALEQLVLEVQIPKEYKPKEGEPSKDFREVIAVADHLFQNLAGVPRGSELAFEIVAKERAIRFQVICPRSLLAYVEKQIQGFYPSAHVEQIPHFRFFEGKGQIGVATLGLAKNHIYPIKTYPKLESESLNPITNSLSKLGEETVAAVQLVVKPARPGWQVWAEREAFKIQRGFGRAKGPLGHALEISRAATGGGPHPEELRRSPHGYGSAYIQLTPLEEARVKALQEKAAKNAFHCQVRIVATAADAITAENAAKTIAQAFQQFYQPETNGFVIVTPRGRAKRAIIRDFILRAFSSQATLLLNTEELASIFHFPNRFIETPNIRWLHARKLPPPVNLPLDGTVLGESLFRGERRLVRLRDDDRRRHVYIVGKTGTGKTTILLQMAESDIKLGRGVCYIDPHGDAALELLRRIPRERAEDVIYFDPADTDRPIGLNLLDWRKAEEKDYLVAEWINIFYKLFDPGRIGIIGPQWEHWGRNAALTVMEQPGGGTLIEIPRLFTDADFREEAIENVRDPLVKAFWTKQMAQTAEFHKSEMLNYFVSKFGRFMTNTMMRNIIGQVRSGFELRKIMDEGKILIANLSKGKLGEMNSYLLGMVLVSRLQQAALSRADVTEEQRRDFYLYVDEFQNFTTESFVTILAEARKYRLNLVITNQFLAQLADELRAAVLGNAGTIISFRVGAADAEYLVKELEGLSETDFVNLENFNAYTGLMIDGHPSKPFSIRTIKPEARGSAEVGEMIRQLSRLKFGRDRSIVEQEIYERARLGGEVGQEDIALQTGAPMESRSL